MSVSNRTSSDTQKVQIIRDAVRDEETRLRQKYRILEYQDALGFGIFLISLAGIGVSAWLYYLGTIPAWLCIISCAIFTSFLHEIEHDLIHHTYFKKNALLFNVMMVGVWVFRGNVLNPWIRKKIHLHHHKTSGTADDSEERVLGNGMKHGLARTLITMEAFLSGTVFSHKFKELKTFPVRWIVIEGGAPVGFVFYGLWFTFLAYHGTVFVAELLGHPLYPPYWLANDVMPVVNFIAVINLIPNVLRQAILNFITSNMHYHGDVDSVMKQTQVLNPWYFGPLQLFCFNFGSTHSIHHFVVNQPFYLREMVKKRAHEVMREQGVRFNDLGTFGRANRYNMG